MYKILIEKKIIYERNVYRGNQTFILYRSWENHISQNALDGRTARNTDEQIDGQTSWVESEFFCCNFPVAFNAYFRLSLRVPCWVKALQGIRNKRKATVKIQKNATLLFTNNTKFLVTKLLFDKYLFVYSTWLVTTNCYELSVLHVFSQRCNAGENYIIFIFIVISNMTFWAIDHCGPCSIFFSLYRILQSYFVNKEMLEFNHH